MPNVTTCTQCKTLYEAGSSEQADEAVRYCPDCAKTATAKVKCSACNKPFITPLANSLGGMRKLRRMWARHATWHGCWCETQCRRVVGY